MDITQISDFSKQPFGIINADNGQIRLKIENSQLADELAKYERENIFTTLKINDIEIFENNQSDWNFGSNYVFINNVLIQDYTNFEEFFVEESVAKKLKVYFSVLVNNTKKLEYETYIIFINRENSTSYKYLDGFDYTSRDTYMVENEPFYIGSKFLNSLGINYKAKKSYINIENSIYNIDYNNFRVNIENKKYNIIEYIPYLDFDFKKPVLSFEQSIDLVFFDEIQTVYQFLANAYTFDINNVTGKKLIYSANVGSTDKSFIDLPVFNLPLKNNNLIKFIDEGIFDIVYHCKLFYNNEIRSLNYFSYDAISDFIGEHDADYANIY